MFNNTLSLSSNQLGYSTVSYINSSNISNPTNASFKPIPNIQLKGNINSRRARMHKNPGNVIKGKLEELKREKRSLNINKVPIVHLKVDPDVDGCARKNMNAGKSIFTFRKKAKYDNFESLQRCAPNGSKHEYKCKDETNIDFQFYDPGYCDARQSQPKNLNKCDQANLDYYGENNGKYDNSDIMAECMPRDSRETFFSHVRAACSFIFNLIDRDGANLGSGIYCRSTNPQVPFRIGGKLYTSEAFIPTTVSGGNGR